MVVGFVAFGLKALTVPGFHGSGLGGSGFDGFRVVGQCGF